LQTNLGIGTIEGPEKSVLRFHRGRCSRQQPSPLGDDTKSTTVNPQVKKEEVERKRKRKQMKIKSK
jgi:hypothetical protein